MTRLSNLSTFFLILLLCQTGSLFSQKKTRNEKPLKIRKVGMMKVKVTDSKRKNWRGTGPKTVNSILWYPTEDTSKPETLLGPFVKVPVLEGAKMSGKGQKYPLILFSHGAAGSALHLIAWGHYLASRGYIVASVNHRGDSTQETQIGPVSLSDRQMWQRPQDLTATLNQLLKDPVFASKIDMEKIAAGGFSLGGYTVIALAGAKLDLDQLLTKSDLESIPPDIRKSIGVYNELLKSDSILQQSLKQSGHSYKDKRVKGVFALAPAIGEGFTETGLQGVDVPVSIVVGEKDLIAPKELNAQLYANGIKGARLTVLPGEAGHITEPGPQAEENWIKVFELSYLFYQSLWKLKN